jgi:membrane protein DedA with SNARE-associated domain
MTIEIPLALVVIVAGALIGSAILFFISYRMDKLLDVINEMDDEERAKFYETRFQRELKRKDK